MNTIPLDQQRLAAAMVTKGISHDAIYQMAMRLIQKYGLRGELLEFGCGTGNLITALLEGGYAGPISGTDIMPRPESIPPSITWLQADLNEPLPIPPASFDNIISTDVIEHLENPRAIFREFSRLLRPGGKLIVTTPNQQSLRSLMSLVLTGHFEDFKDNSYPAHISALLHKDFERICGEAGFSKPEFYYTDSGAIPKFPWKRWEHFGLGGRWFSDGLAMTATKLASPTEANQP